jgi:hypothetical protein
VGPPRRANRGEPPNPLRAQEVDLARCEHQQDSS